MTDDARRQLPTSRRRFLGLTAAGAGLLGAGALLSTAGPAGADAADPPGLPGAWRARVTIDSGPFVGALQFLLMYDSGGGMVESSNFDEAIPVPPAYGSWVANGPIFRSTYIFFTTKAPADPSTLASAGWSFSGSGKFREQITLARDGGSYSSQLFYQLYDTNDIALAGQSGAGRTVAARIVPEPFESFGP